MLESINNFSFFFLSQTIDWVVKLESQLYPVLNSETVSTDVEVEQVNDKLSNIIPEIKRAQQEIELRIKTAKELIAEGMFQEYKKRYMLRKKFVKSHLEATFSPDLFWLS